MGVKGLWQLLEPAGRPVTLESLEGKFLAVDVSLWLHQAVKGGAGSERTGRNPHLSTLFSRLLKLTFYRIRPIFVFDGPETPLLKKSVLSQRRLKRDIASLQLNKYQRKLLAKLAKFQATPTDEAEDFSEVVQKITKTSRIGPEDLFQLEPLPVSPISAELDESSDSFAEVPDADYGIHNSSFSSDSTYDVDLDTDAFKTLPSEAKLEWLVSLKDKQKQNKVSEESIPSNSNDFSQFQLSRLFSRNKVTRKLADVNKNLNKDVLFKLHGSSVGSSFSGIPGRTDVIVSDSAWPQMLNSTAKNVTECSAENDNVCKESIAKQCVPSQQHKLIGAAAAEPICTKLSNSALVDDKHNFDEALISGPDNQRKPADLHNVEQLHSSKVQPKSLKVVLPEREPCYSDSSDADDFVEVSNEPVYHLEYDSAGVETNLPKSSSTVFSESEKSDLLASQKSEPFVKELQHHHNNDLTEQKLRVENAEAVRLIETQKNGPAGENLVSKIQCGDNDDLMISEMVTGEPSSSQTMFSVESQNNSETATSQPGMSQSQSVDPGEISLSELEKRVTSAQAVEKSVTQDVYDECQQLLRLFGVPYLVAPGEAEAQCAQLECQGLTAGTITDDSDIWLFGGSKVYRNVFNKEKYVQYYQASDIHDLLGLDRKKLILAGMITGCDYTAGIENVGMVSALEIISEFTESQKNSDMTVLNRFKEWWTHAQCTQSAEGSAVKNRLKNLLCTFPPSFPDKAVWNAFMQPNVDISDEKFSFGTPDLSALQDFLERKVGMSRNKFEQHMLPIKGRLQTGHKSEMYQTHISSFAITLKKEASDMKLQLSKRTEAAVSRLKNQHKIDTAASSSNVIEQSGADLKPAGKKNSKIVKRTRKMPSTRRKRQTRSKQTTDKEFCLSESSSDEQ